MRRTGAAAALSTLLCVVPILVLAGPTRASVPRPAAEPKPSVTAVSPGSGSTAGGAQVTLKGRALTGVKRVLFGSTEARVLRGSAGKLVVQAPAHAAGPVPVRVITHHGASKPSQAQFTYVTPPPVLGQLTPRSGPATGGTTVTLTGRDLTGATGVRFGGASATFHVVSATTISATSPAHTPGDVTVTVTSAGGSTALDDAFSYVAAPTITYLAPGSGPLAGSTVTLFGTGFTAGSTVMLGGVPATNVHLASGGTELTATTPAHAPGWVDVAVSGVGGTAHLPRGYLYVGGTSITGISPAVGPASGGLYLILLGSGFDDSTLVTFGSKPSLEVDANAAGTVLTVLLPPHPAGAVDVTASNEGDSSTLAEGFTYVDAPTLSSVDPGVGPIAGGTSVTLTGSGFRPGLTVSFGGVAATGVAVVSPTQATAVVPSRAAGAVDVVVTTPGGAATLTHGYTYVRAPTLSTVAPTAGPVGGGTTVGLTGSGFRAGMTATFGGVAASSVTVDSATQATVMSPPHAAGTVTVVVTTPGGSDATSFSYVDGPSLSSVAPSAGPTTGGTSVTLTGAGFAAGMTVTFGGTAAATVTIDSATQATVTTPAHPVGPVDVTVTTPGGGSTSGHAFTFVEAPTLGSLAPSAGPTDGGTTVVVTGTNLRAGMTVTFGGVAAPSVTVDSGTQATVTTPPHAAGPVTVAISTPGGSDSHSAAFTYVEAPTLTSLTPNAGPLGGATVSLTGTGLRAGMTVLLGTTPATGVVVNPDGTEATAVAPPRATAATVDVSVATAGGAATLPAAYSYLAAPDLVSVAPAAGPPAGGTTVALTGSGFFAGMGVAFDGVPSTAVSVVSSSSATVVAPAGSAGPANVTVTTPGGSDTLGAAFTYVEAPTLIPRSARRAVR